MSKRSRNRSDIRGFSKIKSITRPRGPSDSEPKSNSNGIKCICVADPSNASTPMVNDVEIEEIGFSSCNARDKVKFQKCNNFTEMINTTIGSDMDDHRSTTSKTFINDSAVSTASTSKSYFSRLRKDKSIPQHITDTDIENMREIIRIDKGLPTTKEEKRIPINVFKSPLMPPRPNRASYSRYQCSRASFPKLGKFYSSRAKLEKIRKLAADNREEEEFRKLRDLAEYSKRDRHPSYKFNRVFALRYQHNKGNPAMPNSFRQSYERFNKPLFRIVKGLELPRRYLMPEFGRHEISLLGLVNEQLIPLCSTRKTQVEDDAYNIRKRKAIVKRGRVVRAANVQPTGRKIPWNYGRITCPRSI